MITVLAILVVHVYTAQNINTYVLLTSRPIGTYADIKREARGREAPEGERFISAYVPIGRDVSNLCHRRCALLGRS